MTPIIEDFENLSAVRTPEFFKMVEDGIIKIVRGESINHLTADEAILTNG
jgi:hypothetical protein